MTELELELWNYIYEKGKSTKLRGKDCHYLKLGAKKLFAYFVTCEYIVGQDKQGNYEIDEQQEKALYLEK